MKRPELGQRRQKGDFRVGQFMILNIQSTKRRMTGQVVEIPVVAAVLFRVSATISIDGEFWFFLCVLTVRGMSDDQCSCIAIPSRLAIVGILPAALALPEKPVTTYVYM
jgi:hypothetical protein